MFPEVGLARGIPAQAQPNVPVGTDSFFLIHVRDFLPQVNLEPNSLGFGPQHNAVGVPAAVPHPFIYGNPIPNQAGAESLRQLAFRYLHHPGAQVSMVSTGTGAARQFKVVIILQSPDIF